jgi:hypothetical protein
MRRILRSRNSALRIRPRGIQMRGLLLLRPRLRNLQRTNRHRAPLHPFSHRQQSSLCS